MRVNFQDVPDDNDNLTVPVGVYDVKVVSVYPGHTRDGNERWGLRLEVLDGEFAGKLAAWDGLVWSERGMPRIKSVLEVLGFDVQGELEVEPDDLEGRKARVEVVIEEYESATGVLKRGMAVPYGGWAVLDGAPGDVDEEGATREALVRDSPF